MIKNSNENGNAVFLFFRERDGIANIPLVWEKHEMVFELMQTESTAVFYAHNGEPGAPEERHYIFEHCADEEVPYRTMIIWRYEPKGKDLVIIDVQADDLGAITFAREAYMSE